MPALLVTDLYDEPNEKDSPSASVTSAPSLVKISGQVRSAAAICPITLVLQQILRLPRQLSCHQPIRC